MVLAVAHCHKLKLYRATFYSRPLNKLRWLYIATNDPLPKCLEWDGIVMTDVYNLCLNN